MKANEIRISNWLLNAKGEFVQVYSLSVKKGTNKLLINDLPAKEFSAILLTPDILHYCGFSEKITTYNIIYQLDSFRLEHDHEGEGFILLNSEKVIKRPIIINDLHTLQNIYHVLTNEVLSVNLKKVRA
jgi:hypothetical protein